MAQERNEPPEETLGLRLLLARTRKRWSLRDLAKATGIPDSALSRYERDITEPTAARLAALARALGTTPNDLLDFGGTRVLPSGEPLGAAA